MTVPAPTENGFSVVPMAAEHLGAAARIERESFSDPWSEKALGYLIPSAVTQGFACVENASGALAAYGGMEYVLDEGNIVNIATAPAFRRRGCARAVLCALLDFARERKMTRVILEVRVSNGAARALYASFGFTPVGRLPGYYAKPREDGLIMALQIQ